MPIHDYLQPYLRLLIMPNGTTGVAQRDRMCRLLSPNVYRKRSFSLEKHCLLLSPLLYLVIPVEMRCYGKALILLKKTEKPLRG